MSNDLYIQVVGLDKVEAAFKRFPQEIEQDIGQAAAEAAKLVIAQEGVSTIPLPQKQTPRQSPGMSEIKACG